MRAADEVLVVNAFGPSGDPGYEVADFAVALQRIFVEQNLLLHPEFDIILLQLITLYYSSRNL